MENTCPCCLIKENYFNAIVEAETVQEVYDLVHALFEEAEEYGFKSAVASDIEHKISILREIDNQDCNIPFT